MNETRNLCIDGERLWTSIMAMAKIGATEKGGCNRLALTDLDREARDLFIAWCRDSGLTIRIDQMGNIFARRAGRDDAAAPVLTGSHLDTQPTGGKFDGVYGVLSGLEMVRTLNDLRYQTERPIEVVVWTNEEGSRFPPSMVASGVFAGKFSLAEAHAQTDPDGITLGDELVRIGYAGEEEVGKHPVHAYFEAHIEQGPILEAEAKTIGIVTGAQGMRWYEVTLTGAESHAGTTPMDRRRDALLGAARLIDLANRISLAKAPDARLTVGMIEAYPNSRNVIPGRAFVTIDARHPVEDTLADIDGELRAGMEAITADLGLALEIKDVLHSSPVVFDAACVEAVRQAARATGHAARDIVSGAGHDACNIAAIAPAAMIFIPCADGISHNESERASQQDCAAGCDVLLRAVLAQAGAGASG
jgi:N-carbamoyl-L-amino-acid hydrolase